MDDNGYVVLTLIPDLDELARFVMSCWWKCTSILWLC